jgi:hypothetical protein
MKPINFSPDFRRKAPNHPAIYCACCQKPIKDIDNAIPVTVHWADWTFIKGHDMKEHFPDPTSKEISNEHFGKTCFKKMDYKNV